jgi:putative serine protease PepD
MNRRRATAVALLAAAVAGGVGGAVLYASVDPGGTQTVVRQVTAAGKPVARTTEGLSVNEIYRRTHLGVVDITAKSTGSAFDSGSQGRSAEGSGFVYDDLGHIVTNQHVVDGAGSITVKFPGGTKVPATVVGTDASTDVAVLKVSVPDSTLHPLELGDSSAAQVGDVVVAIGSPFGLEGTVTSGIVSALHRQMTSPNGFTISDSIQTDAPINHGNSGGPLLDTAGKVIGVNAQIESDSGGNDGVGFAIPSKTVRSVVSDLLASGTVKHAYLGVALAPTGSARTTLIRPGTPAERAGLHAGDVITSVNGKRIRSSSELTRAIEKRNPGDTISVTYTRRGVAHTVRVTLATRPP